MSEYIGINLKDILRDRTLGESVARSLLSSFSCPLNPDVEHFIKHNAIEFTKQSIASTYLILASHKKHHVLVGYFTLANKTFFINKSSLPSRNWEKRISKFGQLDKSTNHYTISAPLIAQLGKNYTHSYNKLITGDELLKIALNKVRAMQNIVGGKIVYLECQPIDALTNFYSQNGFVNFGYRSLSNDEIKIMSETNLIQMLKYIN